LSSTTEAPPRRLGADALADQVAVIPDRLRREFHRRVEQLFLPVVAQRERQRLAECRRDAE